MTEPQENTSSEERIKELEAQISTLKSELNALKKAAVPSVLLNEEKEYSFRQLSSKTVFFTYKFNGEITRRNDTFEQFFGKAKSLYEIFPTENRYLVQEFLDHVEIEKKASDTLNLLSSEGEVLKFDLQTKLINDERIETIGRNITRISESYPWLRTAYFFYKSLYENDETEIFILDSTQYILECNLRAASFRKGRFAEIIGTKFIDRWLNYNIRQDDLDKKLRRASEGHSDPLIAHGHNEKGEKEIKEISFRELNFFGQPAFVAFCHDISATLTSRYDPEFVMRYRELKIDRAGKTLDPAGESNIKEALLKFTDRVLQMNYLRAAGIYQVSENGQTARLSFFLGLAPKLLSQIYKINTADYKMVFGEQSVSEIPAGSIGSFQQSPLLFIPITIESEVPYAFLFELDPEQQNANLMLRMLGIEIGRSITELKLNRKLRFSEERFRTVANKAPALMRLNDEENRCTFFNSRWESYTGHPSKSLLRNRWKRTVHPDDLHLIREMSEHISKKERFEKTFRIRSSKGEYRWFLEAASPFFDTEGHFQGYVCSAVDITERKAREQHDKERTLLRQSREKLRKSLENSIMPAFTLEPDFSISFANRYFGKVIGTEHEKLIGRNFKDFLDTVQKNRLRSIRDLPEVFEISISNLNRPPVYLTINCIAFYDAENNIHSVTVIAENVTEKKHMLKVMRQSNSLLRDLFDNTGDLILLSTADQRKILLANRALKHNLGLDENDLRKKTLEDLIHPRLRDEFMKTLDDAQENGSESMDINTVLQGKNNIGIPVEGSISISSEIMQTSVYRLILRNVTDQRRAEKARRLYYRIAKHAAETEDLNELYQHLYEELARYIPVESFIVALRDDENTGGKLTFPFFRNANSQSGMHKIGIRIASNLERIGEPLFFRKEELKDATTHKGALPKLWMSVPLFLRERLVGVLIVQSFSDANAFNRDELNMLSFVSGQLAGAVLRKLNQEKIRKQAFNLKAIFESGSFMMWSINRRVQLIYFNQNFAENIRNNYGTFPEKNALMKQFVSDDELRSFWIPKYEEAFSGKEVKFEYENTFGSPQHLQILLSPIFDEQNKVVTEVSGLAHDISERKRQEQLIKNSERKFRRIFESFQDLYLKLNAEGYVRLISPSAKDFFGLPETSLIGLHITDFWLSSSEWALLRRQLSENGSLKNFEARSTTTEGNIHYLIANFSTVREDNTLFIEGTARDISSLKQASEELRKAKDLAEHSLEVKKQFLSNMSHEIRTPLNGIIGMIDLLSSSDLSSEQEEFVGIIKRSSEALLSILNDILDLSKIEAGKMRLRPVEVNLRAFFKKPEALFSLEAYRRGNEISFELDPALPETVLTDETRLLQIFSNLISNAVKFTEYGRIKVRLELSKRLSEKELLLKAIVADTGIGISEQDRKKLFSSFSQVEGAYTKTYSGTGLGLAISRDLCSLLGGEIGLNSEPGKGSTFHFTFKAIEPEDSHHRKVIPVSEEKELPNFANSPKILITDDNPVNLKVAVNILMKSGCDVTKAQSGYEAIALAKEKYFDLILMDIQMPEMNGIETTRKLKKEVPDLPPVIAMTAFSLPGEKEKFLEAGLDDYLSKPLKIGVLLNKIAEYVPAEVSSAPSHDNAPVTDKNPAETDADIIFSASKDKRIINKAVTDQLIEYGDKAMLDELFADLTEETEELITTGQKALRIRDFDALRKSLHTIKGSAGTLGAEQISDLAASMDSRLKKELYDGIPEALQLLESFFEDLKSSCQAILKEYYS